MKDEATVSSLPLRYRLEIAGIALDVHADASLDLQRFDGRAQRYARKAAASPPDHVLQLDQLSEQGFWPPNEIAAARLVDDIAGRVCIEAFQCRLCLGEPGRTDAWIGGANGFENVLRLLISRLVLQRGGAVLHAAALRCGDVGVVFPGVSGAGKSTLTLRQQQLHQVSEDMTAIRPVGDGWILEALPFLAAHALDVGPRSARVVGFAFPRKAPEFALRALAPREMRARIGRSLVVFASARGLEPLVLERTLQLSRDIPGWELELDRTTPFWPELLDRMHPSAVDARSTADL